MSFDKNLSNSLKFDEEHFKTNFVHYRNYNDEIELPYEPKEDKIMVKRIKQFRSKLKFKLTSKILKK